jgi:shikimate kinase
MQNLINIVLVGPMGAGKTSIGKIFASTIGWSFYDSDQVIEERAGADLLWIYDLEGEEGFRKREKKIIAELLQERNIVLATGGGTVAVEENRMIIAANRFFFYLNNSLAYNLVRTGYSKKRPLSAELEERRSHLIQLRQECEPYYEKLANIVYDTGYKGTRTVVADLITLIQKQENITSLLPDFKVQAVV